MNYTEERAKFCYLEDDIGNVISWLYIRYFCEAPFNIGGHLIEPTIGISDLETQLNYRQKGHASKLLNNVINQYGKDYNLVIAISLDDPNKSWLETFYRKLGFDNPIDKTHTIYLFQNTLTLIKYKKK